MRRDAELAVHAAVIILAAQTGCLPRLDPAIGPAVVDIVPIGLALFASLAGRIYGTARNEAPDAAPAVRQASLAEQGSPARGIRSGNRRDRGRSGSS